MRGFRPGFIRFLTGSCFSCSTSTFLIISTPIFYFIPLRPVGFTSTFIFTLIFGWLYFAAAVGCGGFGVGGGGGVVDTASVAVPTGFIDFFGGGSSAAFIFFSPPSLVGCR